VRYLEGLIDPATDSNAATTDADEHSNLSALPMRFIPLIESFLTVCGCTILRTPSYESTKSKTGGDDSKRKIDDSDEVTSSLNADEMLVETLLSHTKHQAVPGAKYRENAEYMRMHMELEDGPMSSQLITFVERNRVLLNSVLKTSVHLLEESFSPLILTPRCRHLLHFDVKRAYFKLKLKKLRQSTARNQGALRVSVRRQNIFHDSFDCLRHKTADEMRRRLSVTFHDEEGIDAGGLTREWYSVIAREIFNVEYALFKATSDTVTFEPNSQSSLDVDHLRYFKFIGRIIGKAICDGQLLDAHFTRSFYKHILGQPVNYHDLEAIEPDYYKSLKQILEIPLEMLGLDLTFSAESNDFGEIKITDLIPNGRNVYVNDDNKHYYVQLISQHRKTNAIKDQIEAFLDGFHDLVRPELISIFDAQELELLISGLPDIDIDDLRANTDYHGYKATDQEITFFWSVMKSLSKEEKALFLQFVTGTSKVPLDGFKALQGSEGIRRFNIHKAYGTVNLPSAHTCFNQLDLPEYSSEEIMREKLLLSIKEGIGFGFA